MTFHANPIGFLANAIRFFTPLITLSMIHLIASTAAPKTKATKSPNILAPFINNSPIPLRNPINASKVSLNGSKTSFITPHTTVKYILNALPIGPNIGSMIGPRVLPAHSPKKPPIALPTIGANGPRNGPSNAVPTAPPIKPPAACPTPAPIAADFFSPDAIPVAIRVAPPNTDRPPAAAPGLAFANLPILPKPFLPNLSPFLPIIRPRCFNLLSGPLFAPLNCPWNLSCAFF